MSTFNETASGGIELAGIARVPYQNILDADLIGSPCVTHTSTKFCCLVSGNRRTVGWRKINNAYVSAITVCGQRLF